MHPARPEAIGLIPAFDAAGVGAAEQAGDCGSCAIEVRVAGGTAGIVGPAAGAAVPVARLRRLA